MNDTRTTTADRTDTRDMLVVHAALLRELRLAPAAVTRAAGSTRRRTTVVGHLRLILSLLDHHHQGEDDLLLPLLRARVPETSRGALDVGEEQHARIEALIAGTRTQLELWERGGVDEVGALSRTLTALHAGVEEHLRAEERAVLPLAEAHLSPGEWAAIGEAGFRSTPRSALVLVFGMFLRDGDPEVVRSMLAEAPAVARMVLPHLAPVVHARRCRRVHGTPRP